MKKINIVKTIQKLGIFISSATFTHYYNNMLNSNQLKAQQVKDQNTEKAIENLNNKMATIQQDVTLINEDTKQIDANVKDLLTKVDRSNLTNKQLEVINSKVENIEVDRVNLEKVISDTDAFKPEVQTLIKNLLTKMKNDKKELQNFIDEYLKSENNFISNFIAGWREKFYEFLDSLTLLQESAFLHIVMFITLMCIVLNILGALFGNEIINYFNLEKKYPSLATFFKIRSTLQKYYLTWNIFLMLLLCSAGIGINILVFYLNP